MVRADEGEEPGDACSKLEVLEGKRRRKRGQRVARNVWGVYEAASNCGVDDRAGDIGLLGERGTGKP